MKKASLSIIGIIERMSNPCSKKTKRTVVVEVEAKPISIEEWLRKKI